MYINELYTYYVYSSQILFDFLEILITCAQTTGYVGIWSTISLFTRYFTRPATYLGWQSVFLT